MVVYKLFTSIENKIAQLKTIVLSGEIDVISLRYDFCVLTRVDIFLVLAIG